MTAQKAMMAMPTSAPAMRRHLVGEHEMSEEAAADMEMPDMRDRHDTMHESDVGHTHSGMAALQVAVARKSFAPIDFKLSEAGDVTVAFSRLDVVDADNDVTRPGAIPAGKAVPMSAYGHTSWDGALPTGRGKLREADGLGIFDGKFFMDTDQGRNAHATVKAMAELQQWSYGYKVLDGGPVVLDNMSVRELRRLDVYEISPVLIGAGVGTSTLAIKSGAPGPETPWAERLSWYVDSLSALLDHGKARQELRASEGRKLSRTDRARLEDLEVALNGHLAVIHELLLVPEDPKAAQRRLTTIMVEVELARMLGVPV